MSNSLQFTGALNLSQKAQKRKRRELINLRQKVEECRSRERERRGAAGRKRREEEAYDAKAEQSDRCARRIRSIRKKRMSRIGKLQRRIDMYNYKISRSTITVEELNSEYQISSEHIPKLLAEAEEMRNESDLLRRQADMECIVGSARRQMGIPGAEEKLRRAEEKQKEAQKKEQEANNNERRAVMLHWAAYDIVGNIADYIDATARLQGDIEKDEAEVAKIGEDLDFMKREAGMCEAGARFLREEERLLEEEVYRIEEQAEQESRSARIFDEEADKLQREIEEAEERSEEPVAGPS